VQNTSIFMRGIDGPVETSEARWSGRYRVRVRIILRRANARTLRELLARARADKRAS